MSEHVATQRRVTGVVMLSGALPLERLGAHAWPPGVPGQIHYTRHTSTPARARRMSSG
jgi:hypothetical protein